MSTQSGMLFLWLLGFGLTYLGIERPPDGGTDSAIANQAESAIERDARETLNLGGQSLFLTRRADLEEELVALQYILRPSPSEQQKPHVACVEIFDIKLEGFKVKNNTIVESAVDLDNSQTWRAAFDCSGGKLFHLQGFDDNESGFNALIKFLDLELRSQSDALVLASDFVRLTYRDSTAAILRDELSFLSASAEDYDGPRNLRNFKRQWDRRPLSVTRQIAPPIATSSNGGYTVVLFTYKRRTLNRTSLRVKRDGATLAKSKDLFAWTSLPPASPGL